MNLFALAGLLAAISIVVSLEAALITFTVIGYIDLIVGMLDIIQCQNREMLEVFGFAAFLAVLALPAISIGAVALMGYGFSLLAASLLLL